MSKVHAETQAAGASGGQFDGLGLVFLCLLATGAVIFLQVLADPRSLLETYGDSDDATRLIQIRELVAHWTWFDTSLTRFGGEAPLVSHWSRLADLPIALIIRAFTPLVGPEGAEMTARLLWPAALLLALSWIIAAAAEKVAGRTAAVAALVLVTGAFLATTQFWIGRIDHHGVQIAAAVAGVILLAGALKTSRYAVPAGLCFAFSLSIGYESLLLAAFALGAFFALAAVRPGKDLAAQRTALSFLAGTLAFYALTVAPSSWTASICDAAGFNMVMATVAGCAGIWFVFSSSLTIRPAVRLPALAGAGAAAAAAGLALHPSCLAGPFGDTAPELARVWLDHVRETQSFAWLIDKLPAIAITYLLSMMAALAAAVFVWRRDPSDENLFYGLVFAAMAGLGLLQVKLMAYAAALSILPLAVAIVRLPGSAWLSRSQTQIAALVLSLQLTISLLAHGLAGVPETTRAALEAGKACRSHAAVAPLARLGPGLAVSGLNHAAALVAGTGLNVFAAPYHRLDQQILQVHAIFHGNAEQAERLLRGVGADYVIICRDEPAEAAGGFSPAPPEGSLLGVLRDGSTPAFLQAVRLDAETPLAVWRVQPR